jgi:putative membrane-bound dehydrogenase-like protein
MLVVALCLAVPLLAQDRSDPGASLTAPPSVKITLWAESPLLYNPTAVDVDARGRVWVAEAVNYRRWGGRNPGRTHPEGDRIVVLEDRDNDGRAETSTVFAQDKDLTAPLGIAVIGDRVFVSCSPSLFVYRDKDGDLKADEREMFLTGFGGFDHDHGLHSVTATPWGELFWCAGNAGPHLVRDRAGFMLRSGSAYNGGGPTTVNNQPGLVSDDGRAWVGGVIGTVRADGTGLRVLAHNFRNQYEVAADAFGAFYTADNDDDGNAGCRTVAITEGGNYGYFSADGARYWQADRRPGQERLAAHWHQDDPGVMPLGCGNGGGGPTGVAVYEGALLPELQGAVLNCDAGRSVVYAHRPQLDGASLRLAPGTLLSAGQRGGDSSRRFRPSDVAVAADGSILVADWYDPGVGGHAMPATARRYGRILRLVPQAHAPWLGRLRRRASTRPRGTCARSAALARDRPRPTSRRLPPATPCAVSRGASGPWARDAATQPRVRAALQPRRRARAAHRLSAPCARRRGFDLATATALVERTPRPYVRAGGRRDPARRTVRAVRRPPGRVRARARRRRSAERSSASGSAPTGKAEAALRAPAGRRSATARMREASSGRRRRALRAGLAAAPRVGAAAAARPPPRHASAERRGLARGARRHRASCRARRGRGRHAGASRRAATPRGARYADDLAEAERDRTMANAWHREQRGRRSRQRQGGVDLGGRAQGRPRGGRHRRARR